MKIISLKKLTEFKDHYFLYFREGALWSQLTSVLETPIAKLSLLAPILGQVLIFLSDGGWVQKFLNNSLDISTFGSYILYWSLVSIAVARLLYMFACPSSIRTYKTIDDYIAVKKQTLSYRQLVDAWEKGFQKIVNNLGCSIDAAELSEIFKINRMNGLHNRIHQELYGENYPEPHLINTTVDCSKRDSRTQRAYTTLLVLGLLDLIKVSGSAASNTSESVARSYIPLPTDSLLADPSFVAASTDGQAVFHRVINLYQLEAISSEPDSKRDDDNDHIRKQRAKGNELFDYVGRGQHVGAWQRDAINYLWEEEDKEMSNWRICITRLLLLLPALYFLSKAVWTILHVALLTLGRTIALNF